MFVEPMSSFNGVYLPKEQPMKRKITERRNYNTELVLKALENSEHKWRSAYEVSKETGLGLNTVERIIAERREQIIQSRSRTRNGLVYYTTSKHFRKKASCVEKILGVIKNRIL